MNPPRERMGSTLLLAYASTGVSQVVNQTFFFILLKYIPIEGVGLYSLAVAIATIFTYVMDLGLPPFLVGELSKHRYQLKTVLGAVLLLRLPVLLLGVATAAVWVAVGHPSKTEFSTLSLVTLTYIVQMLDGGIVPWFQATQRQNTANLLAMIVPLARLGCILCVLSFDTSMTLNQVVWISLLAQIVGSCCLLGTAWWKQTSSLSNGEAGSVRQLMQRFRSRGPGLAVMYSVNILQARLDWILVSVLISDVALAGYSVANKVIEMAMLVAAIWARTSFPWLSQTDLQDNVTRTKLTFLRRLFILSTGLSGVILFFWSQPLLAAFFGSKFADAYLSLAILTMATAVFMQNQYFLYELLSFGLEKIYTRVILAASIVQVALNVFLLPRIGVKGAALALVLTGVLIHAGQMALLISKGQLRVSEVVRMNLFGIIIIGGLLTAWTLRVTPLLGTVLLTPLTMLLGFALLFSLDDRTYFAACYSWMRHAIGLGRSTP